MDRGYTGHEHLQSVGIINMNGRLYDPLLHRFLSPDNFVQDPFITSIQVGTALEYGAQYFLTNDIRLKVVKEIKR